MNPTNIVKAPHDCGQPESAADLLQLDDQNETVLRRQYVKPTITLLGHMANVTKKYWAIIDNSSNPTRPF